MDLYKKKRSTVTKISVCLCVIVLGVIWYFGFYSPIHFHAVTIEGTQSIDVIGTKDFGDTILFHQRITSSTPLSALQAVQQVAETNTSYGGGFITAINGKSSTYSSDPTAPQDWFYYVNGMLSPVGANQYECHDGDVIRWDYHHWATALATTAIIADFPEPFLHGYNGKTAKTSIVYTQEFYPEAQQIQQTLSGYGVSSSLVRVNELDEKTKTTENVILIGTYENNTLIQTINSDADNIGLFITWDRSHVNVVDASGALQHAYPHAGCIIAMQNHWNPKGNMNGENVIWMITGVTHEDIQRACSALSGHPERFQNATSAVITETAVMKVP